MAFFTSLRTDIPVLPAEMDEDVDEDEDEDDYSTEEEEENSTLVRKKIAWRHLWTTPKDKSLLYDLRIWGGGSISVISKVRSADQLWLCNGPRE